METIHFKTVDPVSQELLRKAFQKGIDLNWERYERQQPQDGFLRLGLTCPYGCMQGPCRIDPFGRGAQNGICGLDRNGMVAAFLLRLTLHGILERMVEHPELSSTRINWFPPFASKITAVLGEGSENLAPLTEIFQSVSMLARPSASPQRLIGQAIRLGLLAVGPRKQGQPESGTKDFVIGYGLLANEAIYVGVTGRFSWAKLNDFLREAAGQKNPDVRVVSLGEWIPMGDHFLPIVCTSGEAETVLSSGRLNLLLVGDGTDPGVVNLCRKINVPVVFSQEILGTAQILKRARDAFDRRIPGAFTPDATLMSKGCVRLGPREMKSLLKGKSDIAFLGGFDSLVQSLGHLPVELAKALYGEGHAVASWGDAALWMTKQDLPISVLDAKEGPLEAVRVLVEEEKLSTVKGICFTGFRHAQEFTMALGLAAVGLKVLIATPLPLWGSEKVRSLLHEELAALGGELTHFDHPGRAEEILDWFLRS